MSRVSLLKMRCQSFTSGQSTLKQRSAILDEVATLKKKEKKKEKENENDFNTSTVLLKMA